ncbi:TetR/AcrR family transcriptional regulator [Halopseudomonas phragmitis]|uniref:TetR family transcriptional regulator n=2 Tax=Pseudomonadaceae TaxID=135621 RepID=A0A1V0B802_9GAMM|nr:MULTISPECIES: TetR/AcrR family transcriptional regulator [Pseudomonadaceae]AQZ96062.1 TetR family transcriptional regulator [Halopseudomonas phragmitis]RHW20898.1 TetR/AcrR family transcriptional regulator [Pseudomonas jilinensis]
MSVEQRREREKQERRDSILDAAEQVFFSKGYERCSMDEIARAAQVSRALLYVYFKDKAAIMRGIMLRAGESIRSHFRQAMEASSSGAEQIENIGRAYYHFSVEHPNYFDVLTQAQGFAHPDEPDEQSLALQQCSIDAMHLMIQALLQGVADGSLSAERVSDPLQTAYYLRGALHGVIMQCRHISEIELPDHPNPEQLVSYTLGMLTQSMRP